jgi:hypothetical protein
VARSKSQHRSLQRWLRPAQVSLRRFIVFSGPNAASALVTAVFAESDCFTVMEVIAAQ